jgi:hypothetical protein
MTWKLYLLKMKIFHKQEARIMSIANTSIIISDPSNGFGIE